MTVITLLPTAAYRGLFSKDSLGWRRLSRRQKISRPEKVDPSGRDLGKYNKMGTGTGKKPARKQSSEKTLNDKEGHGAALILHRLID